MSQKTSHYFDYAATTPLDPSVARAMAPYFSEKFGNPGSLHRFGQAAIAAVDAARTDLARLIGADFREVIFTSSATEANNLALRGTIKYFREKYPKVQPRLIISAIEHESVLETAHDLEKSGVEVVVVPVDAFGVVNVAKLRSSLNECTVLVSIMLGNNEIGTIQPIANVAEIIRQFKDGRVSDTTKSAIRNSQFNNYPLFHIDAAQAFSYIDVNVGRLGADLLTLSAHKMYGPKGIGALYIRRAKNIEPIITGGGQEFGLRSGTENVPLIVGLAAAAKLAVAERVKGYRRVGELRAYFLDLLQRTEPRAVIHGPAISSHKVSEKNRSLEASLPHIASIYLPGRTAADRLSQLDLLGFAISAGSACRARSATPSPVIRALGFSVAHARNTVRVSFGRQTTKANIEQLAAVLGR